jgi:cytochrome c-L
VFGKTFAAVAMSVALVATAAQAEIVLRNTITGELLNLDDALPEGRDTPAVKKFLETGVNSYVENKGCLPKGEDLFLSACSGCHGHLAEGKVGPGLNDNYWTYPKNATDQGLFETIFGGAQAQMGPQYGSLTLDDILLVSAWVRRLYTGPAADAEWLSEEQKKTYRPYQENKNVSISHDACKTQ